MSDRRLAALSFASSIGELALGAVFTYYQTRMLDDCSCRWQASAVCLQRRSWVAGSVMREQVVRSRSAVVRVRRWRHVRAPAAQTIEQRPRSRMRTRRYLSCVLSGRHADASGTRREGMAIEVCVRQRR